MPINIAQLQPKAWAILTRSFQRDRVASTYLFHGLQGVGHWSLFVSFAALLNCENRTGGEVNESELLLPCGTCGNCRKIFSLNFEGLLFAVPLPPHKNANEAIDLTCEYLDKKKEEPFAVLAPKASANIPIGVARQIKANLTLKAPVGITRMVLFYRMENMRPDSADALLKLIEEPPPDTVIVLTSEKPAISMARPNDPWLNFAVNAACFSSTICPSRKYSSTISSLSRSSRIRWARD